MAQVTVFVDSTLPLLTYQKIAREHCTLDLKTAATLGVHVGEQVRVKIAGELTSLYTVKTVKREDAATMRVGPEGFARLTGASGQSVTAHVSKPATLSLSESDARAAGECIEKLEAAGDPKIVVIAPHGGDIEPGTDTQAQTMYGHLATAGKAVQLWTCHGYRHPGFDPVGPNKRWHITSTDISEHSFPGLRSFFTSRFEIAIAFHGCHEACDEVTSAGRVFVGGAGPKELRQSIQAKIQIAVPTITVETIEDVPSSPVEGASPKNIVNRLSRRGIQIEQTKAVRECFGKQIALAIAEIV
jgi:phage replication-related protein YjqB (UPF0714/DUF867 family)